MLGGTLAAFMTACIAGMMIPTDPTWEKPAPKKTVDDAEVEAALALPENQTLPGQAAAAGRLQHTDRKSSNFAYFTFSRTRAWLQQPVSSEYNTPSGQRFKARSAQLV